MRYRVTGANQNTGAEISITIDADYEQAAEAIARSQGILVSDVVAEQIPGAPDESLAAAAAAAQAIKPYVPMYEGPKKKHERYRDITRGATVLRVLAILAYAAGGLCVLSALIVLAQMASQSSSYSSLTSSIEWFPVISLLLAGLFYVAIGALLAMAGAVGIAIRDIADNSFLK